MFNIYQSKIQQTKPHLISKPGRKGPNLQTLYTSEDNHTASFGSQGKIVYPLKNETRKNEEMQNFNNTAFSMTVFSL